MAFKEGDRVVWEKKPDERWKVHYLLDGEWIQIIRHERGGFASIRVPISEVKHFDRYGMIKQAVREVLLSDEFLKAFAKAWGKIQQIEHGEISLISGRVEDLAVAYNLNEVARQHTSPEITSGDFIAEQVEVYSNEVEKYER